MNYNMNHNMNYQVIIIILIILIVIIFYILNKKENFVPFEALTDYKDLKLINNLFKKTIPLLEKNNIEYWIHSGTLIGAIQNKGIIPWDDDIDISILDKDVDKLLNLKSELNSLNLDIIEAFFGYKIYDKSGKNIDNKSFKFPKKNVKDIFLRSELFIDNSRPFIDIFITKNNNNIIKYISKDAQKYWENDYFTTKELFPLKKYQFEDYYVFGPNNPYEYLNRAYPDWKNKAIKTVNHITHKKIDKIEFDIIYDELKPILWQYWEGNLPDYIKLCMETVDKHCSNNFKIIRLNPQNIKEYLPEIEEYEENINTLIIPQKVDIYRIMLLYKYGGMYMDADVIVLRNPSEIMDKLKEFDFVGFGCTGKNCKIGYFEPSNWLLVSRPNTILMRNILNNLINKIKNINSITTKIKNKIKKIINKDYDTYHDFGKHVIWTELKELKKQDYTYYHYPNTIDGTRDVKGEWVTSERIFSNQSIEYDDEENMMFLIIYNSGVNNDIKTMSREEILNKDCNYSKFIKKSLALSSEEK